MEPDDLTAERGGLRKQASVGRYGNSKPGPHEIFREPCRESRMRHDSGEVRHHVLRLDGPAKHGG